MGAALFIVLEKEIPGFDATVNGKALSRASKGLERLTTKLGVKPLMEFCSMDLGEVSDFLGDLGGEEGEIPPEQWFAPEEGLRTVEALRTHLRHRTEALPALNDVLADLDDGDQHVIGKHGGAESESTDASNITSCGGVSMPAGPASHALAAPAPAVLRADLVDSRKR